MIGKIHGKIIELEGNEALIETSSGLSYYVFATSTVISKYPVQSIADIYTYLQVRDDAHILFGFNSKEELKFFKLLLSVSGVGPKTAFLVISHTKTDELLEAVKTNTLDYFTKIPGLGKKTAMKIILELSQKIKSEFSMEKMNLSEDDKTVIEALVALGYKSQDAKVLLSQVPSDITLEKRIQEALKLSMKAQKRV